MSSSDWPVTPAEDPSVPTDDPDPGHLLPQHIWDAVVAGVENDDDEPDEGGAGR